ncbi:RNA polymerase sigma factor [Caulobacter sp. BP25]|uniref:RNA polymerase sigma factor n=1 Tax=Caulobacter sp. BP25 TaxID=2048900 RepID=UPI0021019CC7|nr:sigma-70 family RNA polymerase sigma factor [Caulobacter sp. BP25]
MRRIARITRDPAGAEDVVQSAMVRMLEYRRDKAVANPEAFVARAAVNLAIDERRQRARRLEHGLDFITDTPADAHPLQDEVLRTRDRLARLKLGMARLSPRTREVFLLHRLEGLKYREIAEQLGITVSAVEKHVAKASLFLTKWTEQW